MSHDDDDSLGEPPQREAPDDEHRSSPTEFRIVGDEAHPAPSDDAEQRSGDQAARQDCCHWCPEARQWHRRRGVTSALQFR